MKDTNLQTVISIIERSKKDYVDMQNDLVKECVFKIINQVVKQLMTIKTNDGKVGIGIEMYVGRIIKNHKMTDTIFHYRKSDEIQSDFYLFDNKFHPHLNYNLLKV